MDGSEGVGGGGPNPASPQSCTCVLALHGGQAEAICVVLHNLRVQGTGTPPPPRGVRGGWFPDSVGVRKPVGLFQGGLGYATKRIGHGLWKHTTRVHLPEPQLPHL